MALLLSVAAACGGTEDSGADAAETASELDETGPESGDTAPAADPADSAPDPTDTSPVTEPVATTSPPAEDPPDPGDRSSSITLAIDDLAERLGIEGADEVVVVLSEDVTWRNGSLGCPEPGMAYTQALVDGFRVILEVEGVQYAYHSGRGHPPFLCESPASNEPLRDT